MHFQLILPTDKNAYSDSTTHAYERGQFAEELQTILQCEYIVFRLQGVNKDQSRWSVNLLCTSSPSCRD